MYNKLKKKISLFLLFIVSFSLILSSGCGNFQEKTKISAIKPIVEMSTKVKAATIKQSSKEFTVSAKSEKQATKTSIEEKSSIKDELKVSYINVDQGDSILIQQDDNFMLIDTGEDADSTINYLNDEGVSKLDFLILSHPNADNFKEMLAIIINFDFDTIIIPDVTHTKPEIENKYDLGEASFQILASDSSEDNENLNNFSITLRIEFRDNSFIFVGDSELVSNDKIINNGLDIESDVLKVSHHGSNTSSNTNFLDSVNPDYAVVMCAANNQYGHPQQEVIDNLSQREIEIFRTDLQGTIIATSDGKQITFTTQENVSNTDILSPGIVPTTTPSTTTPPTTVVPTTTPTTTLPPVTEAPTTEPVPENYGVFKTNTGTKYHKEGCRYLKQSKIPISKEEAISQNLEPCSVCKP